MHMKSRFLKNRIYVILTSFILVTSLVPYMAFASESQDQLDEVNEQQEEAITERAQLQILIEEQQAEVVKLNKKVAEKQAELDTKQVEIDALIQQINEQRASIDDRKDGLCGRLRSMYKNGSVGFMDVLFKSSSLSEFLSNLSMVQLIYKNDQNTLEELEEEYGVLKDNMATLGAAKAEMEVAQAELQAERDSAAYAEAQLEETLAYVQAKIDELEAEKAELEAIIAEEQRQALAAGYVYTGGSGNYIWPVSGPITYGFGYRDDPAISAVGGSTYHEGIDIGVPTGTPVVAAAEGTVSYATGWSGGYGYAVFINHPDGSTTVYGHNSSLAVSGGDYVAQGQVIAYAGSTGWSTGPHVHFEIRINGVKVNPLGYL